MPIVLDDDAVVAEGQITRQGIGVIRVLDEFSQSDLGLANEALAELFKKRSADLEVSRLLPDVVVSHKHHLNTSLGSLR